MELTSSESTGKRLVYSGKGNDLAFIMFKNLLLTVLTLGLYFPWGRTNRRRFIWGQISYLGDRATYTGQGAELFKGWVILLAIYFVAIIIINLLIKVISFVGIIVLPLYIYLYALIIYSGTRYLLSRTKWREINFGLDKDKKLTRAFIILVLSNVFYCAISLGLYIPFYIHNVRKFLTDKSRFGGQYFNYTGTGSELFKIYSKSFVLIILTLGIYIPWFYAESISYRLKNTHFGNAHFILHLKGKDVLIYSISSYILTILTLGIATPWVLNWGIKIFVNSIEIVGDIDFQAIQNQVADSGSAMADIAAVEYDIDFGI